MVGWWWVGGLCDFSVSPSPFGLEFGTLDFGTSDSGLTILIISSERYSIFSRYFKMHTLRCFNELKQFCFFQVKDIVSSVDI